MMIVLLLIIATVKDSVAFQPEFVETISNVSVPVGRDATFTCHVRYLGGYRVGWLKADTKAIQAIHENVITHNPRVSVSHLDQNTWNLHIKAVTEEDRGGYMCQLNTDPMKSQIGFLDVVIPPDFVPEDTSSDVIVPEGSSVKLTCRARGYPEPIVTWRREDGNEIILKDSTGTKTMVSSYRGEVLKLTKISRNEMGSYLCIASNGVPPSVSKRINLNIHFHPVIQVPNQLVGAPLGTDVQIECHVEASPKSINYWIKDTGEMIVTSVKYHVQESSKSMYETKMSMIVRKFQKEDVGSYRCIAKNSLGEVDSSIRLYEIPGPNRKNSVAGKGGDADANDILKMKQLKVTYQPDDEEDLYGSSAEDFDSDVGGGGGLGGDGDVAVPPLSPNVYYTGSDGGNGNGNGNNNKNNNNGHASGNAGHKPSTHKTNTSGTGSGIGSAVSGAEGRHHHHHQQQQHHHNHHHTSTAGSSEYASANGGAIGGNGIAVGGVGGGGGITRKPPSYGKTEIRGPMDNNAETSSATATRVLWPGGWSVSSVWRRSYQWSWSRASSSSWWSWCWWWWWWWSCCCCCLSGTGGSTSHRHWQFLMVLLLVPSLITSFCWNLL